MIVVQRITTEWTKDSRGGEGALKRNATPDAVELPLIAYPTAQYILHDVRYLESKGFVPDATVTESSCSQSIRAEPLILSVSKRQISVRFVWSWHHCGAPERDSHDLFRLDAGQWGRFTCNGRFGAESTAGREWGYRKTVLNVALLETYDTHVFTETTPVTEKSSLASLR